MSRRFFRRLVPRPESLARNRALAALAPFVRDPRLWRLSRRGVALGIAIGVFFGLLIPFGQIPLAVILAFALRANVGAAAASTLVTNPFTFPPLYLAAYHLGAWLLDVPVDPAEEAALERPAGAVEDRWWHVVAAIGKPLALGLAVMAASGALAAYYAVSLLWRAGVWLRVRRRSRRSARGPAK